MPGLFRCGLETLGWSILLCGPALGFLESPHRVLPVILLIIAGIWAWAYLRYIKPMSTKILELEHEAEIVREKDVIAERELRREKGRREKLNEDYQMLHLSVSNSPMSIMITDAEAVIEYVNPALSRLSGYSEKDLIGKKPSIFKSKRTSRKTHEELWQHILSGKSWTGEFCNTKKNGAFYYEIARITPIKNSEGQIKHFFAIKEDVTDARLARLQLEIQTDELKESNACKDRIFSVISHDLRSPLAGIISFSKMLAESYDVLSPEDVGQVAQKTHRASTQLYSLLERLLDWARFQSGRTTFDPKEHNLWHLVHESAVLISTQAMQKEVHVMNEVARELTVTCDAYMIATVLRNLLSNAVKYTTKGEKVTILASMEGDQVIVSVKDNGVGMSSHVKEHLFDMSASEPSRLGTDGEKGSGLGLILCRDFVNKHGHRIWVESNEGEGTCFNFILDRFSKNKNKSL